MKQITVVFLAIFTFLIFAGIGIVSNGIGVYNTHIDLKTQIEAQQKANEANFDAMWKKITQVAKVSDEYKNGLKEVLAAYVAGRKKDSENLLMDWTKEAIPTFDASIYKQINNVIVGSRDDFYTNQKLLIDLSRQHNKFIQKFPNNIYCKLLHIEEIKITVVTSTKTEEAFKTGKDDNIELK